MIVGAVQFCQVQSRQNKRGVDLLCHVVGKFASKLRCKFMILMN